MTQQITAQLLKGGLTVDASGNISATKLIGDLQGNVTGDLTGNADTATTATTADSADTLNQQTSINLSGTYSTHQLLVADAYALTGDVTVNDNLILGKLSDDGNDILIEGNYTFTTIGAGKVEAGYVTSSGIGSVDGMTGELGSGVTLGSGMTGTLGTGVGTSGWEVDYLVIAGGGSGGHGAGGAGGYRLGSSTLTGEKSGGDTALEGPLLVFRGQVFEVQVGRGNPVWVTSTVSSSGGGSWRGSANMYPAYGGVWPTQNIENSVFGPITSVVGGAGTIEDANHKAHPGGSGGGSGANVGAGEGIPGQGFKGAQATANSGGSKGGGGGAGGAASGLTGGIGLESSITGIAVKRAGGGGGGVNATYGHGYGGNGDWGGGRSDSAHGSGGYHPATNKGGGGGGGYMQNGNAGGDGIVILSYPNTYPDLQKIHKSHVCNGQGPGTITAPSPTTLRSGFKCYEFTAGSGGISW